jgi:hypothetical protein
MRRLTEQQCVELCRLGGVPNDGRDRFVHAIERCVMYYQQSRERKTAPAVGAELAQIEKCAWRALRLLDRRTPRPAEFRRVVEHISARLRNLSSSAQEYLEFRNLKIQRDVILAAWPDLSDPGVLVDPICFTNQNDQVLALQDLLGAFAAPVAKKEGRGHPPKDLERALYHFLAAAYSRVTDRAASDSSAKFMAVCFEIKRIYQLNNWNPGSLARLARQSGRNGR